jgi:hypothetical protein
MSRLPAWTSPPHVFMWSGCKISLHCMAMVCSVQMDANVLDSATLWFSIYRRVGVGGQTRYLIKSISWQNRVNMLLASGSDPSLDEVLALDLVLVMFYFAQVLLFTHPKQDRSRAFPLHHSIFDIPVLWLEVLRLRCPIRCKTMYFLLCILPMTMSCSLRGAMRNVAVQMWLA